MKADGTSVPGGPADTPPTMTSVGSPAGAVSQKVLTAHQPVTTRTPKAITNDAISLGFDIRTSLASNAIRCANWLSTRNKGAETGIARAAAAISSNAWR